MLKFSVSERFACRVFGQHRSTQRKTPKGRADEEALTADIIRLASRYGRYGYRRITAMLRSEGWTVNAKRVERIWRREGLKVPQKQPKRGRLWLNDGSCIRLRPEHPNHVWSYDFVEGRTHNGRKFRMLNIIDEFTRECLAIRIDRKLNSTDVIDVLSDLFILRGVPGHVRSDNGPEFIAKAVREWIAAVGAKTAFIEPGSPWENGYCESFNSKLRDELLNSEIFYSLAEARVIIEAWRRYYNTERPHSSLGYKPPAPEAIAWPSKPAGSLPPARNHLVKVVHCLAELGHVDSTKGKVEASAWRTTKSVRLGDLVKALETNMTIVECFNRDTNTCTMISGCTLKHFLADAKTVFLDSLNEQTLAETTGNKRPLQKR